MSVPSQRHQGMYSPRPRELDPVACGFHGAHQLKWAGFSFEAVDQAAVDCERPNVMVCECRRRELRRCNRTDEAKCAPCARRHRMRVFTIAREGVEAVDQAWMITLTAPGQTALPWDRRRCTHPRGEKCSGNLGCVVRHGEAAEWNSSMTKRRTAWMTAARRLVEDITGTRLEYFNCTEPQQREVAHSHLVLKVPEAPSFDLMTVRAELMAIAVRLGYGDQFDIRPASAREVAAYCSGYVAKAASSRHPLPFVDRHTGELLRRVGHRPWSASRAWGSSMRSVVEAQRVWAAINARSRQAAERVAALEERARRLGADGDGAAGALDHNPEHSTTVSSDPGVEGF